MRAVLYLAIACCLVFSSAFADQWQVVNVNKVTLEGSLKNGGAFSVRIDSDTPKGTSGELFGATDVHAPRAVVSGITVKTDNARISFPKQAYGDLANPLLQTVSVTSQPSGNLRVRFTGGEGPSNYEVEYFIEGNKLVRRNVSYFDRGGEQKGRVVKTMTFSPAGDVTQPATATNGAEDE
jgi:hypothetical protein